MDIEQLLQEGADEVTLQRFFYYERYAWLSLSHDMAAVISLDGQIMDVNNHWELTTGHPVEDMLGSYLLEYIHFEDREQALAEIQRLATSDIGSASVTFRFLCKDQSYRRTLWNVIFSPDHSAYFCMVRDASEESREQLEHYAYRDTLTGLLNRLSLSDSLPGILEKSREEDIPVVLFFIDLDGFKAVNDTFGHKAGDTLLVRASQRMRKLIENQGDVYRICGDEFVIILKNCPSRALAEALAGDLVRRLSAPYLIEGERVHTGASVGIAQHPLDASNMEILMECADQAMYHVKRTGKNGFAFHNDLSCGEKTTA
ncbi:MAG: sensor domain-containing diguanylate cyclase [Proteobacteria bacterium]|nr:sensor domain-containing diguanylate cyclase [Pseudomonadota bacterium]MBU1612104.1 sensor domain-containing diguanylate cyclase [Pseudomonadota bacterium]